MSDKIYERFDKLREQKNVTVYAVSKATGITTTTFTNWKKGKYTPKPDKLQLIADYFGVSLNYLMVGSDATENKYNLEIYLMLDKIANDEKLSKALIKYFNMSDEQKKHVINTINFLGEK